MKHWERILRTLLVAAVAWPAIAVAAVPAAQIEADFKALDGYVVMQQDHEILIDLDHKSGLRVGDLVTVLGKSREVVHPATQKVLGKLEQVKGVLKVTQMRAGYSFTRLLTPKAKIRRGDRIRRYGAMRAVFWDYTGHGRELYQQLKRGLPDLKWRDYQTDQRNRPKQVAADSLQPDQLGFVLKADGLQVLDTEANLVRRYAATTAARPPTALPRAQASSKPAPAAAKPGLVNYGSADALGDLGGAIKMADMAPHGAGPLWAVTDGKQIRVYRSGTRLDLVYEGRRYPDQILSVKWYAPEPDVLYIVANAWSEVENRPAARILSWQSDRLQTVKDHIPLILGAFDLDGDGRPETLLGQEFDPELFYGRRIKQLTIQGGKLETGRPGIELPQRFAVVGSRFADLDRDGSPEAIFVRQGILRIYSGKKVLYKSAKQMGGTLSVLTYKKNAGFVDFMLASAFFEVSPVTADIDGDGLLEILAIASDQPALKAPGISNRIKGSRLVVLKQQDGSFVKGTLGEPLDSAVQGLSISGRRVLYVASEPGSLFGGDGMSRLKALDLVR